MKSLSCAIFFVLFIKFIDCGSINTISPSEWKTMVENRGIYTYRENSIRNKRFISFDLQLNQEFQNCTAPGDKPGHCRHLHYCLIDEIKTNYVAFMSHFCKIGSMFVGICCPDSNNTNTVLPERLIEEPKNELEMIEGRIVFTGSNPQRGCGITNKSRTRIVGGRPADPKEWPWMAALLRDRVTQFCGGVLISNWHVMTAAHCTTGFRPQQIKVRLGEYDFSRTDDSLSRDFRVVDLKQHPNYDDTTTANDIAVLKVHRSVAFDEYVWPICLPNKFDDFASKPATVTGWGSLGFAEASSDVLMEVDFPVWSKSQCEAKLEQTMPDTQMCAGSFGERKDACQGDSGGPLMHKLSNGRWVAIGVVSYGRACGMIGQPGIYTRVNQYIDWIIESTRPF